MSLMHTYNLIVGTIGIACTIIILIGLITKHLTHRKLPKLSLQNLPSNPRDSPVYHWRVALDHLTNISIITFLIHSASVSLQRFDIFPPTELFCTWITRANVALYHMTRCTLYAILVIRIYIAFNDSTYSYSFKYIICPLFIIISLWFIVSIFFDTLYGAAHGEYNPEYEACAPIFEEWGVLLSGGFDIILSSILLALFIRPLVKLNRGMKIESFKEHVSSRQLTIETSKATINSRHSPYPSNRNSPIITSLNHRSQRTDTLSHNEQKLEIIYNENDIKQVKNIEFCDNVNPVNINLTPINYNLTPVNLTPINLTAAIINTCAGSANQSTASTLGSMIGDTPNSNIELVDDDPELEIIWNELEIDEEKEVDTFDVTSYHQKGRMDESITISMQHEILHRQDTEPDQEPDEQPTMDTMPTTDGCLDGEKRREIWRNSSKNLKSKSVLSEHQNKLNTVYEELITRYALLVILCIGSSFLMYLGVFIWDHWVADLSPIDDAINVWCIILISKKSNKVYHCLCYPCNWFMKLLCVFRMNVGLESKRSNIIESSMMRMHSVDNPEWKDIQTNSSITVTATSTAIR